ncbi:MAG: hypothetical protein ACJ763_16200 [Bdellovibrionia bacterium]
MRTLRGSAQIAILLALQTSTTWMSEKAVATEALSQGLNAAPTIQELERGIASRLKRVEEFKFIEEEATKLGVRAYLFGGTAAGYAHYVKWDLQREKGDSRFQKDRFDYDYTNIYRSTQDLDIVIDGNPEQATQLQIALQQKYPHLQGNKTAWEVRLLTQDMGDKQAILNNPDFLNQHTDSNSTGMIEITQPKNGAHVVRDVKDWNTKEPYFLKDVQDGMLHYYFSPKHATTKFAKEGRNPPILSAIRFLTKAFQYELKIRPEDLAQIKKIIQEFDPKRDTQNAYVANWIEKNGKKLIQNAVNIEYAKNTLDQLGLRAKLQLLKNNASSIDSLAWWMNKEPLQTKPVGEGSGRTAKELGLDIVAHETNSFLAYESITRAHTGDPNVLISRDNIPGEAAAFGDGFYTKIGKEGARGTGLTIRFHLDPNAREVRDFTLVNNPPYVIVKNKAALKVIPESLNISAVEYFQMLESGKAGDMINDRGTLEKLKRRISARSTSISDDDLNEILKIVRAELEKREKPEISTILREWFSLPVSSKYLEIFDAVVKKGSDKTDAWLVSDILPMPHFKDHPDWIERLADKYKGTWRYSAIWQDVAEHVLSQPHWVGHPELIERYFDRNSERVIAQHILSQPHWKHRSDWVERILDKGGADEAVILGVLSQPHWKDHPEWVERILNRGTPVNESPMYTRDGPHWKDREIAQYVLSQAHWKDHPEWVERLIDKGTADEEIIFYVLSRPHAKDHPEWVEKLIDHGRVDAYIARYALSRPEWKDHPQLVEKLLKKGTVDRDIDAYILLEPHWKDHPALRRLSGKKQPTTANNLKKAFAQGKSVLSPPQSCVARFLSKLFQ